VRSDLNSLITEFGHASAAQPVDDEHHRADGQPYDSADLGERIRVEQHITDDQEAQRRHDQQLLLVAEGFEGALAVHECPVGSKVS
jgi:hypothetical protein